MAALTCYRQMNLKDRNIVITGGSSGIGEATAKLCAFHGAKVGIISRSKQALERVVGEINSKGGKASFKEADIGHEESFLKALNFFSEEWGSISGLVNNAMSIHPESLAKQSLENWQENFKVTLDAAFVGIRFVLPSMLKNKKGSIVNVSSVVGLRGTLGLSAYGAAKSGLISLTQSAAMEAAPDVRVNCVAPGAVMTPATKAALPSKELLKSTASSIPLKRIAEPEEIASVIAFLLSSESSYLTGICINADGGKTSDLNAGISME